MPTCLVSFGANLGDRHAAFDTAIERLRSHALIQRCVESTRVETAPVGGPPDQPPFLNSVARFETSLKPVALLRTLQTIESEARRERGVRWGVRTLDLDLIAYGDEVIRDEDLLIPHPRMSFRLFVLQGAAEIFPDWRHPELDVEMTRLLRMHREGLETVSVLGGEASGLRSASAIRQLVRLELPASVGCRVNEQSDAASGDGSQTPRLTIDSRLERTGHAGGSGPRLVLADCPRGHWREEVRAAIRCVWPRVSGDVS